MFQDNCSLPYTHHWQLRRNRKVSRGKVMSGPAKQTALDLHIIAKQEGIDIAVGNNAAYRLISSDNVSFSEYAKLIADQLEGIGIGNGPASTRLGSAILAAFIQRAEEVNSTNAGHGVCWSIPWNVVGALVNMAAQDGTNYFGIVTELKGDLVDSLRAWKPLTAI
jgi:hypothetical protein